MSPDSFYFIFNVATRNFKLALVAPTPGLLDRCSHIDQDSGISHQNTLWNQVCGAEVCHYHVGVRGLAHFPGLTAALLGAGSVEVLWCRWENQGLGRRHFQGHPVHKQQLVHPLFFPFHNRFQSCLVDSEPSAHPSWLRPKCLHWRWKLPTDCTLSQDHRWQD